MAILAIGAVSASEDISDDVSAIEPTDEVISDQIDDNLEETDSQAEDLAEDGETKSLTDFKDYVETAESESNVLEINLTNNYKYNPDTDENVTRVALDGENYRFKTIILDGKGHSVDGGGKDLIMRLGYMMSNVTVKNIIFKNFNRTEEVSSGYRDFINVDARNGKLENITLENISSSTSGYLIYLQGGFGDDDSYALENCVFKDNDEVRCFLEIARNNVQVNNCNFTNNDATYFISDDQRYPETYCRNIQLNNCNFEGNNATYFIDFKAINSQINGCNFTNNDAWGYGYLTNQFGNNSKMSNCIFEDNFIGHDHSRFPVAWFGDLDDDQPTGENISVSKVTFKNNVAIPIRWDALSGNVTDCVFIGNNGTIDNRGNVYRDNGKYDFEVTVYNDTIVGAPDNPMGYGVYPGYGSENILVDLKYYGARTGNIVILLNGTECYNKPLEGDSASIKINELDNVQIGELDIVVKFINGEDDLDLYDDKTKIDYYLAIDDAMFGLFVSPHGTLTINFTLPKDATGTLIFDDEIQNHTLAYSDGKASFTVKGTDYTELRQYVVALRLIDDPKYPYKEIEEHLIFNPMVFVPKCAAEGEPIIINLDFPDAFESNFAIYNLTEDYQKGELIFNKSFKGVAQFEAIVLDEGEHHFIAEIPGYHDRIWIDILCIKNLEGINSSIDSDTIEFGENATVHVNSNVTNCTVMIMVDGGYPSYQEDFDLNETTFTQGIPNLSIGNHTIEIIIYKEIEDEENPYAEPEYDYYYYKLFKVTVKDKEPTPGPSPDPTPTPTPKVPAKIVAKDYKAYYNKGTYTVTVYGTDGKVAKGATVVFKINGKKVKTVKTNSKGVAKFKIPAKYVPKAYKISATALGKTVTKKLTIKQVLKLKKVKVKKSAKKLVITATLKEGKKALKGKKITFRFKGKKYVKKTNKKGVAKVTIKKKVLKKLKKGKKVTYKATYLKDTVKRTVRVKK